jgi:hypothetical protein
MNLHKQFRQEHFKQKNIGKYILELFLLYVQKL